MRAASRLWENGARFVRRVVLVLSLFMVNAPVLRRRCRGFG